ncbi:MAG: carbamoyltransferase [Myxococcales bacterium]|nr:carbamoyltransferase [Myxococcales bacterium]
MTRESDENCRWRLPAEWRPNQPLFAFHEDTNANAVLIDTDGRIFAVAEERLTRRRFQGGFPRRSLAWIEQASGVPLAAAPVLVFGNRTHFLPRLLGSLFPSFEHDLFGLPHKTMLFFHHLVFRSPLFARGLEGFNRALLRRRFGKRAAIVDHHFAHAASAYYTSGKTAACAVSIDNYGDGCAARVFDCEGPVIRPVRSVSALDSPGQFYGEIAQLAGIHPLLAGKLTGLAAHGDPAPAREPLQKLFGVSPDGRDFSRTFGWRRSARRPPFADLTRFAPPELAAAAQAVFEDAVVAFVQTAARDTGRRDVVLAGGCFGNVRVNQRIRELPEIDSVWIHPAMSDQGIALGAALAYLAAQKPRLPFRLPDVFLGPEPHEAEIEAALRAAGLPYTRPADPAAEAARLLAAGQVVARFAGPTEYGPRALGNRSVLYDPRDPALQARLNAQLHRAWYMPFAPLVMASHAAQCFLNAAAAREPGRFMTISFYATDWLKQNCPGVVHVDGTVRPQIIDRDDNPPMYRLLEEFHRLTGIPCLLNTSFNLHEEPIVCSAADACRAFRAAKLDYLIAGPFLARRSDE